MLQLAPTLSGRKGCQLERELCRFIEFLQAEGVRSYLEVGSRFGDALHAVGLALPEGSRIVSVELADANWGKSDSAPFLERAVAELRRAGRDAHIIWGDSRAPETIAAARALGPYDAVLIDGDHRLEGVVLDWMNYGPMARFVAFHDIAAPAKQRDGRSGDLVDVPHVWAALRRRYNWADFTAHNSHMGIGVLWR